MIFEFPPIQVFEKGMRETSCLAGYMDYLGDSAIPCMLCNNIFDECEARIAVGGGEVVRFRENVKGQVPNRRR